MDIGSIGQAVQLTVLRRSLDMAATQADQMIKLLEVASPAGLGERVDLKV